MGDIEVETDGDVATTLTAEYFYDSKYYTEEGVMFFTPNSVTPRNLYYQCGIHDNMGNEIKIIDNTTTIQESIDSWNNSVGWKSDPNTVSVITSSTNGGIDLNLAPTGISSSTSIPFTGADYSLQIESPPKIIDLDYWNDTQGLDDSTSSILASIPATTVGNTNDVVQFSDGNTSGYGELQYSMAGDFLRRYGKSMQILNDDPAYSSRNVTQFYTFFHRHNFPDNDTLDIFREYFKVVLPIGLQVKDILHYDPVVDITSPAGTITGGVQNVDISFVVQKFNIKVNSGNQEVGKDGWLQYQLDGGTWTSHYSIGDITLSSLSIASHTVNLKLVDMSGNDISVTDTVTFSVTA